MPAADGVDARARRVAARLLSTRARRSGGSSRPDAARHRPQPVEVGSVARTMRPLEQDGWALLSQVQRPGRSGLPIDHIAIGPGGVVVIDSRHWVGRIEVTRGVVQQNGFWREQECAAVARTAGSVAALLLPQHRTAVHAMICVVQHDLAEHLVSPGVRVVGLNELGRALRAMPYRLHPAEVLHLHGVLSRVLMDAEPPDQLTTAELDDRPGSAGPGAHRDLLDPASSELFVPMEGATLRGAARPAPRRRRPGLPWWRQRRAVTPWGPAARWPAAGRLPDSPPVRLARLRNPRLMLVRTLFAVLLAAAALLLGPGLVRYLGGERPSPPAVVPSASVSVSPSAPANGSAGTAADQQSTDDDVIGRGTTAFPAHLDGNSTGATSERYPVLPGAPVFPTRTPSR